MRLPKILLVLVLGIGVVSHANALTINLGDISNDTDNFGSIVGQGPFTDTFAFSLGGVSSDISGYIAKSLIPTLNIGLTGPGGYSFSSTLSGLFNISSYSFADLAPGNYMLSLSGVGLTKRFSGYNISYKVTTAVPELDAWLMLLVGAGLIALQLRRKHKVLESPTLAS
ncbi:MAG: FxDxF family PEP-CTERM protein [Steroidobacteraceae bacterium]